MSKFSFRSPPVDVALSVGPVTLNWEEIFRQWEMFLADTHPSCKNSLRTKTESISWLSHSFSLLRWFLLREEEVISSNHSSYCRLTYLNIEFLNVKKGFWSVWENVWSGYWSVGKIETHVLFCFSNPSVSLSDVHVLIHRTDASPGWQHQYKSFKNKSV